MSRDRLSAAWVDRDGAERQTGAERGQRAEGRQADRWRENTSRLERRGMGGGKDMNGKAGMEWNGKEWKAGYTRKIEW